MKKTVDKAWVKVTAKKYLITTVGCIIAAFGYDAFILSANLTSGGVSGVSTLLSRFLPLPTGIIMWILNVPLFILSFIFLRLKFTLRTLYATSLLSLFMAWFEEWMQPILPITNNIILGVIIGAAIFGAGLGLLMKSGASSGGTDIVMKLIHRKYRYLRGGVINTFLDGAVIVTYFFITRDFDMTVYSLAAVIITNFVYDLVLYGVSNSQTVYIIAPKSRELVETILRKANTGATLIPCQGAYEQESKELIMCTIRNTMFPTLKHIIETQAPDAFMIVVKSHEIYGNGYKSYEDVL